MRLFKVVSAMSKWCCNIRMRLNRFDSSQQVAEREEDEEAVKEILEILSTFSGTRT